MDLRAAAALGDEERHVGHLFAAPREPARVVWLGRRVRPLFSRLILPDAMQD